MTPAQGRVLAFVRDYIAAFDALPRCIASSSSPDRLAVCLDALGLTEIFGPNHVFSASLVPRGKPHPDLFLHAAATMGAAPGACLVIEDSVPGVTAACAAGMRVVGFSGGGHWGHDPAAADLTRAGASRVFRDYRDLAAVIAAA